MATLNNKRVFIIEDNITNSNIFQFLLKVNGAVASVDRWGVDYMERLQKFSPVDLVILDLMFPDGISGFDIFEEIKSVFPDVPVVAISAIESSVAVAKARMMGFSGFIGKPVDVDRLADQLGNILDGKRLWVYTTGPNHRN